MCYYLIKQSAPENSHYFLLRMGATIKDKKKKKNILHQTTHLAHRNAVLAGKQISAVHVKILLIIFKFYYEHSHPTLLELS